MNELVRVTDPGVLATLTLAALFAAAAFARWRGVDGRVPLLRMVADWVPGVPPAVVAIWLVIAIPLVGWLSAGRSAEPNVLLAVVFTVLLAAAATVVILGRAGAIRPSSRDVLLAALFSALLLASAIASPQLRDSLVGALFGLSSLLVGAAAAYLYLRSRKAT